MLLSNYELRYQLDMKLTDTVANAINKSVACEGVFGKKMPEDDWRKDDYRAVADASKEIAGRCIDTFLAALELDRLVIASSDTGGSASSDTVGDTAAAIVQSEPATVESEGASDTDRISKSATETVAPEPK